MENAQATLLLTRPEPQSKAFLAECEGLCGRRLPVVISPLLTIEPVSDIPHLDRFATLVITSVNGGRRLAGTLAYRRVVTVGEKTASLARSFGASAASMGENIAGFLGNAKYLEGPVLFCRGVHTRGDLAGELRSRGIEVEEAVLYDQVSKPLSQAARMLLTGDAPVIAPVFSPRTAALLSRNVITAPFTLVAMSDAVRDAWENGGEIMVAAAPTAKAMCACVTEAF